MDQRPSRKIDGAFQLVGVSCHRVFAQPDKAEIGERRDVTRSAGRCRIDDLLQEISCRQPI